MILNFKNADELPLEKGSVWEVVRIMPLDRFSFGLLVLRRLGGLRGKQEIYAKVAIRRGMFEALMKRYGFEKKDIRRLMLIWVVEDGVIEVMLAMDDRGGYKWDGISWKYFEKWKEGRVVNEDNFF